MDGVNEKGLAAAVLMLPGERPPEPDTGRTPIQTTLAVRLVLDRAATVDEALALLERYEMHHAIGSAFHLHRQCFPGPMRIPIPPCVILMQNAFPGAADCTSFTHGAIGGGTRLGAAGRAACGGIPRFRALVPSAFFC